MKLVAISLLALVCLALSGCSTLRVAINGLPDNLKSCESEPEVLDDKQATEADVAALLLRVQAAGQDCRAKLGEVAKLLD